MAAFPVKASPSLHANEEGASVLPLKEASLTRPEHSKTATREETTIKFEVKSPVEVRQKLQVFVRGLLLPKTLCVQVYPETSVSALKKMVQVRSGIQPENQHLYMGRNFQLCDLLSLRDHRIHQDQNIELRAGGLLGGGLEEEHSRNMFFLNLASKLGTQWDVLAITLGFTVNELEIFRANSPGNVEQQSFTMLRAWWKKQDNPEDAPEKLRDLLKATGREDLALQVRDVPAEIRNRAVYQRALEKGSATVHRTRLMIVGQERVGKTCLMRSLIHASFNSNELSTEGVTTDCTINISSAQSWNCKRGDSTSLKRELMIGLETEKDKHTDMEPLQPTPPHQLQSSSAASQTQTTETQPSGTTVESTSDGKDIPVPRLFKIIDKAMSEGLNTQQNAEQPTLNIWDFAGQDLYYTTHQTFLSSRAIYLVVFNLCQDLDKPVPVQDEGSGGSITYRTTPIQYLDFWMQSIFTYTKESSSTDRLEQKSPSIFIVGTHRNSVGGDNLPEQNRKGLIAEIFKRIRHEIHNKPYNRHVVSEFYAIENSLEDNLKIEKLRLHIESIAIKEPYMGERIPLNWLAFDDEKGNISAGKPVMTLNQVMDGFGIKDENELLTMLKFYHDLGHIIYFGGKADKKSQALKDVVILDPQWLIDAFKKILTVKHPRKQSWYRLQENGILEDSLINHMWKDILEHKQALLDLMDMFDLLCERVDEPREEEKSSTASSTATQPSPANASYYVPSMLRQRTSRSSPLETIEKNSNVFYVDFEEFLPDGLYHRLVVRALRWSQDLGGSNPDLLYDRASFYVDNHHHFALQMVHQSKLACIKVSVMRAGVISPPENVKPPSSDVTCKVKDFVKETLQNLSTMWIKRSNYGIISVKCPNEKHKDTHFLPLDECMKKPEVVCRFENSQRQVVIKTDKIQAMFKQESPEEEASARADRQPMSDILFREIANDLDKERGKQLAEKLGVESEEVEKIKIDYNASGVNEQIFQMLVLWREKRGNEVGRMRKELIDALIEMEGTFGLAHKVQMYQTQM